MLVGYAIGRRTGRIDERSGISFGAAAQDKLAELAPSPTVTRQASMDLGDQRGHCNQGPAGDEGEALQCSGPWPGGGGARGSRVAYRAAEQEMTELEVQLAAASASGDAAAKAAAQAKLDEARTVAAAVKIQAVQLGRNAHAQALEKKAEAAAPEAAKTEIAVAKEQIAATVQRFACHYGP